MKKKGFTLVELLVVISIMGLLSVVSLARFGTLREDQKLQAAANELQSLIRTAQTNATTNVKCGSTAGATWFVEFKDSKTIDLKCYTSDPAVTTLQKTTTFTTNQPMINSINGQDTCTSSFPSYAVDVSFAPLYGTVSFTDNSPTANPCFAGSSQVSVNLADSVTSAQKAVNVQKGGVVSVD